MQFVATTRPPQTTLGPFSIGHSYRTGLLFLAYRCPMIGLGGYRPLDMSRPSRSAVNFPQRRDVKIDTAYGVSTRKTQLTWLGARTVGRTHLTPTVSRNDRGMARFRGR